MNDKAAKLDLSSYEIVAYSIVAILLLLVLKIHLLTVLLAGLLVFDIVHILSPFIKLKGLSGYRAKIVIVTLLAVTVIVTISLLIYGTIAFLRSTGGNLPDLFKQMADIVEGSLGKLPPWVVDYMPYDADELKTAIVEWLRTHAKEIQVVGNETLRTAVHILVGMVIGAMIALEELRPVHEYRPLSRALIERMSRLRSAFHSIVFAQIRISTINTIFTFSYLVILLPLFGVSLPLRKTLIVVTFVVGMIPVVGNLISNTVIVIISLSHSFNIAISSLVFLMVIHKLEYFLNARIVGSQIKAKAWEILIAMVIMEAVFGIAGVVAAPIYYAYLKDELMSRNLI